MSKLVFLGVVFCEHEVLIGHPRNESAGIPLTELSLAFLVSIRTDAILFAVQPLAFVDSSVRPLESAEALLLVIEVLALVGATVRPGVSTMAMHHVGVPAAVVLTAISPLVRAAPFDIVLFEVSAVLRLVRPAKLAIAIL